MEIKVLLVVYVLLNLLTFTLNKTQFTTIEEDENNEDTDEELKLADITEKNYNSTITSVKHFFILFHNPWCKISQNLEKKLIYVNKLLKMEQQPYYIGSIDLTLIDGGKIIESIPDPILPVTFTYPAFVYYFEGQPVEVYKGKHNKHDIYTHIKRKFYKESTNLPIYSIFESKITHDKNAFIFFGDTNSNNFEVFNNKAKHWNDFMFYHSNEETLYEKLNPSRSAEIIYYSFGKKKDTIPSNSTITDEVLNRFFKKNTFLNFYDKTTEEFINQVFMKRQSAIVLFRNIYDNQTLFLEENLPLYAKADESLKFLITDMTTKYDLKLATLLNVGIKDVPALKLIDFKNGFKKYELTRDFTMENVINFINMWKANQLQPYAVSQSAQSVSKKKEVVKRIYSSNFYESVIFHKRHTVVFFYTKWCTHCKKVLIK